MLPATLWWNVRNSPFNNLEQSLLHSFTGDVARDRWVLRLARDLVDLIDVDDAALCALNIAISGLDQAQQDVLNVLTNVPRLGEAGGVGNAEGNVKEARERLRKERLPGTSWANEQNV